MTQLTPIRSKARSAVIRPSEQGYVLLAAIFFLALLVIALAVAAPRVARSIQRDRELETFHRGMQYRRAIQLYYRKFNGYPPNVDALVKTNNIRFLRKRYIDPMTGKDDWKPVLYGQNKTPTAMGFFGQPLAGTTIAGIGPSGGSTSSTSNSTTNFLNLTSSGSSTSTTTDSSTSASSPGDTSSTGGTSTTSGSTGSTTSSSSGSTSSTTSGTSSSSPTTSGQTFGGAGIIGFSPASPKQSILVYKKKNHYNQWEFTYDPISDMKTMSGGNTGTVGQPASSTSTPVGSTSSSTNSSSSTTTTTSTSSQ